MPRFPRHVNLDRCFAALAPAVCLTALFAAPVRAQESQDSGPSYPHQAVQGDLAGLEAMLQSGKLEGLERQIGKLGDAAIPSVLQALLAHQISEREERKRLIDGLRLVRKSAVLAALETWLSPLHGLEYRFTVLEVLGSIGAAKDMGLIVRAATPPRPEIDVDPGLKVAFSEALTGVLLRDRSGFKQALQAYKDVRKELREPLVQGVGEAGGEGALETLAVWLETPSPLDLQTVTYIGRVAEKLPVPPKAWIGEIVARGLGSEDLSLRREAIHALGRLEDAGCVPQLVDLIASENDALRSAAAWSLKRITGLAFPADARTWKAWLELERQWWSGEASHAFYCLQAEDAATVTRAIEDIAAHRLNRHELARELSLSLRHHGAQVQVAQINALRQLDSEHGVPRLLEYLDSADQTVQLAAWRGLKEVTRKDLPRHAEFWQSALR